MQSQGSTRSARQRRSPAAPAALLRRQPAGTRGTGTSVQAARRCSDACSRGAGLPQQQAAGGEPRARKLQRMRVPRARGTSGGAPRGNAGLAGLPKPGEGLHAAPAAAGAAAAAAAAPAAAAARLHAGSRLSEPARPRAAAALPGAAAPAAAPRLVPQAAASWPAGGGLPQGTHAHALRGPAGRVPPGAAAATMAVPTKGGCLAAALSARLRVTSGHAACEPSAALQVHAPAGRWPLAAPPAAPKQPVAAASSAAGHVAAGPRQRCLPPGRPAG